MSKRFLALFLLATVTMINLVGCKTNFPFLHETSMISSIEIAKADDITNTSIEVSQSYTVENIDAFLEDFGQMKCMNYFSEPKEPDLEVKVVIITYENQDYQIVSHTGSSVFKQETGYFTFNGIVCFDKDEFISLVEKYSSGD